MTKLLVIYDIDGWAYHFRAQAIAHHAPGDFEVRLASYDLLTGTPQALAATEDETTRWEHHHGSRIQPTAAERLEAILGASPPDIVFVLCHHVLKHVRRVIRDRGWATRVVISWNNGWPRRRAEFDAAHRQADAMIINNRDYWERVGRLPRTHPISNGVDVEIFRPLSPPEGRGPRVLWCGSSYHSVLKGHDDLVVPLFARLEEEGIASEALLVDSRGSDRLGQREMAQWYTRGTVLVCASESEGTPNTALEAAACGCTVVTTRVGNMPELIRDGVNGIFVDRDLNSLHAGVRRALADNVRLATNLNRDIQSWSWARRAPEFFSLFRDVLAGDAGPARAGCG